MSVPRLSAFDSASHDDSPSAPLGEEEWSRRLSERSPTFNSGIPGSIALQSWFWFFFLGPLLLFFAGGGFEYRWLTVDTLKLVFVLCAVIAGFLLGKAASNGLSGFILGGILFSLLIVAADVFVCYFGGCAMSCSQMVARGQ